MQRGCIPPSGRTTHKIDDDDDDESSSNKSISDLSFSGICIETKSFSKYLSESNRNGIDDDIIFWSNNGRRRRRRCWERMECFVLRENEKTFWWPK